MPTDFERDTDAPGAILPLTSADAGEDLDAFAPLILDTRRREEAFRDWPTTKKAKAVAALQHIASLHSMTDWDEEQLLRYLGCPIKTRSELDDLDRDQIDRCRLYVATVASTACQVVTMSDRRAVVLELGRIVHDRRLDAKSLRKALERTGADDISALEYVRLGEISSAARAARAAAGLRREAISESGGPFGNVPRVHLSPGRIGQYLAGSRDLLGDAVFNFIGEHLGSCEACDAAVERAAQ